MDTSAALASLFNPAPSSGIPGSALIGNGKKLSKEQIEKAANDFESMFLSQMLQSLFPEQDQTGLSSDDDDAAYNLNGDEAYHGLITDQYAKQIAKSGGIGIARYIQQEMLKHQEVSAVPAATTSTGASL